MNIMKQTNKNIFRYGLLCLLFCTISTSVFGIGTIDFGELALEKPVQKSYTLFANPPHNMVYVYFSLSENARVEFSSTGVPGLSRRISIYERYDAKRKFPLTISDNYTLEGAICLVPGDYEVHIDCVYTFSEKSYSFLVALHSHKLRSGEYPEEPIDDMDREKEPSYGQDPLPGITSSRSYLRESRMLSADGLSSVEKLSYFDGIGRPVQTVYSRFTPSGDDFVDFTDYNSCGLVWRQWLPIPVSGTNSAFVNNLPVKSAGVTGDKIPYLKTLYEQISLNRPSIISGAGEVFKYRPVNIKYLYNSKDNLGCLKYKISGDKIVRDGFYLPGTLEVEQRKDEESNVSYIFKDRMGRVILERSMNGTVPYDTYYVYLPGGDLGYVLPPMVDDNLSDVSLDRYAYQYRYDGLHRLIEKKLPGCEPVRYAYDAGDRLVFSQDGNQRAENRCSFFLADSFGREVVSGICSNSFGSSINRVVSTSFDVNGGTAGSGYSLDYVSSPQVLSIKYYDTYDYLQLPSLVSHADSLGYVTMKGYGSRYECSASPAISAQGKLTGMRIFSPETGEETITSYYYDEKGNVVQQHSTNHLGGYDKNYFAFTFTGKVLQKMHIHSVPQLSSLSERYAYTYDHAERLISVNHSFGSAPSVVLSKNDYDSFCRLGSTAFHNGLIKADYFYNIRGWLTGIHSNEFTQSLHYTDGPGISCYTGNISSMEWKSALDSLTRGYCFKYDNVSRLESASYGEGSSLNKNQDRFNERVAYDRQGNIVDLIRRGQISQTEYGVIDRLKMNYNGNMLQSVSDDAADSVYANGFEFKDGANSAIEYFYDANGNLTKDLNKKVSDIEYNFLNLPYCVAFENGNRISSVYDANGTKLRTTHIIGNDTTVTDYCGNVIYENGVAKTLLTDAGFVSLSDNKYHYYLQDHQGNNRVVVDETGKVEEVNHYYPFGGTFASASSVQDYKYNGKELDRKGGLDWYDYGARMYDPVLGRWNAVDPASEESYGISPYAYCFNNPLTFVDPSGEKPTIYEAALMSKHVYGDKVELTGGWKVSDRVYQGMASKNGFQSALYERTIDGVTEYTYATAGTQLTDLNDLKEDATQLWGDTKQYGESIRMAERLTGDLKDAELTFVGHSLGGGLAAANALKTNKDAITFNPAAITPATKRALGLSPGTYKGSILNVVVKGEIVDHLQSSIGLKPDGKRLELKASYLPVKSEINTVLRLKNHLIDTVIKKLK